MKKWQIKLLMMRHANGREGKPSYIHSLCIVVESHEDYVVWLDVEHRMAQDLWPTGVWV